MAGGYFLQKVIHRVIHKVVNIIIIVIINLLKMIFLYRLQLYLALICLSFVSYLSLI
mgnify:CR=1 FL=1